MTAKGYPKTQTISIAGTDVQQVLYKDEPVVTFAMVDAIHQRPDGTAGRTFRENRERFIEGEDFVKICADEIRRHKIMDLSPKAREDVTFLTRRGYLKLVKPLTDDRAWQVQGEMIDRYFAVEKLAALAPDVLEMIRRDDGISRMLAHKVTEQGKDIATLVQAVAAIAAIVQPAAPGVVLADGVTAGEVCGLSSVAAKYPRGISGRVSRHMKQFCLNRGIIIPVSRLGRVRAQVFPTHAAREWLDVGGRRMIQRWVEERKGQKVLRLVSRAPVQEGE